MTIKEFIEWLQGLPQDMDITVLAELINTGKIGKGAGDA